MQSDAGNYPTLNQEIGQRLRDARKSKGLSLRGLSELTGCAVSVSRLNNYERGIRRLSIEAARALANALGTCTPAYLLCVDDPLTLNADEIALLQKYRETDAQGRALVLKRAEAEANRTAKGD